MHRWHVNEQLFDNYVNTIVDKTDENLLVKMIFGEQTVFIISNSIKRERKT